MMYRYLGKRDTDPALKGMNCWPVKVPARPDQADKRDRCVRGRNGNMLVQDSAGRRHVVVGRMLRKVVP